MTADVFTPKKIAELLTVCRAATPGPMAGSYADKVLDRNVRHVGHGYAAALREIERLQLLVKSLAGEVIPFEAVDE